MPSTQRGAARQDEGVLITSARHGKSLDVHARTRRYLWTMGLRTVLFGAMCVVPGIWTKLACLVGAVLLPAAAVLLANNVDNHAEPEPEPDDEAPSPVAALLPGQVLRGEVVEEEAR